MSCNIVMRDSQNLFALIDSVGVGQGGYGIVWSDELDLSCDELWENGVKVASLSAFDHGQLS